MDYSRCGQCGIEVEGGGGIVTVSRYISDTKSDGQVTESFALCQECLEELLRHVVIRKEVHGNKNEAR